MPENSPGYEELAASLMLARKENAMLRKELLRAYKKWVELERALEAKEK